MHLRWFGSHCSKPGRSYIYHRGVNVVQTRQSRERRPRAVQRTRQSTDLRSTCSTANSLSVISSVLYPLPGCISRSLSDEKTYTPKLLHENQDNKPNRQHNKRPFLTFRLGQILVAHVLPRSAPVWTRFVCAAVPCPPRLFPSSWGSLACRARSTFSPGTKLRTRQTQRGQEN